MPGTLDTRRARRTWLAFVFLFALVGISGAARAQTRPDLEKARAAYLARNYPEAEQRLRTLTDPKTGFKERLLLSQARMYLAATLLAQGKKDDAQEVLEQLILEEPTFEPDPLSFPGPVVNTFIDTRASLQERLRQAAANAARLEAERKARAEAERQKQEAWLRQVKTMAEEEKITVHNQRLVAFVPFGAGQFQNRQPILGWVFLGTEAALAIAAGITVPMNAYAARRADEEHLSGDVDKKAQLYVDRQENIRIVNLSLIGAFAAVAIGGIVHANLTFVDRFVEVKKRPLPAVGKTRWTPLLAPRLEPDGRPNGLVLGVAGTTF